MQAYEIEAYLGEFSWEYDIKGIERAANAMGDMTSDQFTALCESYNMHKQAIDSINRAYENEDYNSYENRIERWSKRLGISYNKLEDDATDVRMYGYDVA